MLSSELISSIIQIQTDTAESTKAMRINCLAHGHNILMQAGFEPSIAIFKNRHLNNMTIMLILLSVYQLKFDCPFFNVFVYNGCLFTFDI